MNFDGLPSTGIPTISFKADHISVADALERVRQIAGLRYIPLSTYNGYSVIAAPKEEAFDQATGASIPRLQEVFPKNNLEPMQSEALAKRESVSLPATPQGDAVTPLAPVPDGTVPVTVTGNVLMQHPKQVDFAKSKVTFYQDGEPLTRPRSGRTAPIPWQGSSPGSTCPP